MKSITALRKMVASAMRSAFALTLILVVAMLTGVLRVSLTPSMRDIATELRTERSLPRGTKLKIGDPQNPIVLAYDKKGRVVLSPPHKKTSADAL